MLFMRAGPDRFDSAGDRSDSGVFTEYAFKTRLLARAASRHVSRLNQAGRVSPPGSEERRNDERQ